MIHSSLSISFFINIILSDVIVIHTKIQLIKSTTLHDLTKTKREGFTNSNENKMKN